MMRRVLNVVSVAAVLAAVLPGGLRAQTVSPQERAECAALQGMTNLTIISAGIREDPEEGLVYCYVRGILSPAIGFHVQLPLRAAWNGRFLKWGDGGKDGALNFADHRVAEGYVVANSNMGHDNGVEPGSSFAYNNRQAEIDFG
ncbi:MAG: tannase/feruloyl esterase family alpha/beta hydrolase, partial [Gemmatimonadota bacterium]|nr:tannase/feruloyl esterase family alpha/beta hydrolase [Gemmatimonadota bacterium]